MHIILYRHILFLTLYCVFPHVISHSEGGEAAHLKPISERSQIEINLEAYGGSTKGFLGVENVHDNIFRTMIPPESVQAYLTENERNAISTSFTRNSANSKRTLQLEKVGFSSSSTFYVQKNRTLPDNLLTSFSNQTEVLSVDLFHDIKNSWTLMNSKTAEGTNATQPDPKHPSHRDNFVPRGGMLGRPFYWPTVGVYISTNHYGSPWKSSFAGNYRLSGDKQLASFFELDGMYACYESAYYSAVKIPLNTGKQVLYLVLPSPNISVVDLYINEGGIYTNKSRSPSVTDPSLPSRRIQLPAIDITSGNTWNREFTIADPGLTDLKGIVCRTTKYCLGPIPQAQYLKFRPDSFEVSSATGTTVLDHELPLLQEQDEESSKQRSLSKRAAANDFDVQERTVSNEILRFDKPFAWYLTNEGVEIYSGIVNPSHIVKAQLVGFEWLTSLGQYHLWSGII